MTVACDQFVSFPIGRFLLLQKKSVDLTKIDVFDRELAFAVSYNCGFFSSSVISQFTSSDWKYLELLECFPSFLIFFHANFEILCFAGCHGAECCKDILKFLL